MVLGVQASSCHIEAPAVVCEGQSIVTDVGAAKWMRREREVNKEKLEELRGHLYL